MSNSVVAATCVGLCFACTLNAVELIAERSDTFICETFASGEFSKSEFIAVSNFDKERALAYLPFHIRADDIGISQKNSAIILASLNLYVKWLPEPTGKGGPSAVKTELPGAPNLDESLFPTESTGDKNASEALSFPREAKFFSKKKSALPPESAQKILETDLESESAALKSDNKKIRIEVWAVVDTECFDPYSENLKVSWDGKHDAPAPKHDPSTPSMLDSVGCANLGAIEFDPTEYEDGDLLEFSSDEFREFLEFAFGITKARGAEPKFKSPLTKIERTAIVLKQTDGPSGAIFYSADQMGDEAFFPHKRGEAPIESGDEDGGSIEAVGANKENLSAAEKSLLKLPVDNALESSFSKKLSEILGLAADASKGGASAVSKNQAPTPQAIAELPKNSQPPSLGPANSSESSESSDASRSESEECESAKKPDYRPRIIFEYRTDTPSE